MATKKKEEKPKVSGKVRVRATPFFMSTRLNVFMHHYPGILDADTAHKLKFGESVELDRVDYEGLKWYFEEVV